MLLYNSANKNRLSNKKLNFSHVKMTYCTLYAYIHTTIWACVFLKTATNFTCSNLRVFVLHLSDWTADAFRVRITRRPVRASQFRLKNTSSERYARVEKLTVSWNRFGSCTVFSHAARLWKYGKVPVEFLLFITRNKIIPLKKKKNVKIRVCVTRFINWKPVPILIGFMIPPQ